MSYNKLYTDKYKSGSITLGNSAELIVALYEKSMSCLSAAKEALASGDKYGWISNLSTVQEIIETLHDGLDLESGNEIVKHLEKFYLQLSLYNSQLITGEKDSSQIDSLMSAFRKTRDSWKNLEERYNQEFPVPDNLEKM